MVWNKTTYVEVDDSKGTLRRGKLSIWARLPYLCYVLARITIVFVRMGGLLSTRQRQKAGPRLLLESGLRGWESIFMHEVRQSAQEYLENEGVVLYSSISREKPYLPQVSLALRSQHPTHMFFDPRTLNSRLVLSTFQAMGLACLLAYYRVTPIVFLTDFSSRNWRNQAAIVSAVRGVVVTCVSPRALAGIFPHRRTLGPVLMPISQTTFNSLTLRRHTASSRLAPRVGFVGLGYSPRIEWLKELQKLLEIEGVAFEIRTDKSTTANEEYWSRLLDLDIVVTTVTQMPMDCYDRLDEPQLVFRYAEAIAAGAILVAPHVEGVERGLSPGQHFVCYSSLRECAQQIVKVLSDHGAYVEIREAGRQRLEALIKSRTFWSSIDASLGSDALL